jgi:hypothetical protein
VSLVHARNAEASHPPKGRVVVVCSSQRSGGSLNLNVHYRVAVPHAVLSREPQGATYVAFHQLPIPSRSDVVATSHAAVPERPRRVTTESAANEGSLRTVDAGSALLLIDLLLVAD